MEIAATLRRCMGIFEKEDLCAGQGTVELAVVLPVVLVVAVIAVNACTFFSECASFDRISRQTIRVCATSPSYGQGSDEGRARVQESLNAAFGKDNEEVTVTAENAGGGCVRYRAQLSYKATLFGLGLKDEVFGVSLPALTHESALVVDPYNPGVLL